MRTAWMEHIITGLGILKKQVNQTHYTMNEDLKILLQILIEI